jgi:hypothetical protein
VMIHLAGPAGEKERSMRAVCFAAPLAVLALAATAYGQTGTGFTITHGDAVFTQGAHPTVGTGTGVSGANLRDSGPTGTDHLFQSAWWFRVAGDTRETTFFNTALDPVSGSQATLRYTQPLFSAVLTHEVNDPGVGATLVQAMQITNTSANPLVMALFYYADFDVSGTAGSDSAVLLDPERIRITDGANFTEMLGVGADNYRVGTFGSTRLGLADALVTDFANEGLPFGPGDFTGAFQWNRTIGAGESLTIYAGLSVNTAAIPEPASLLLLALAGLALRRR